MAAPRPLILLLLVLLSILPASVCGLAWLNERRARQAAEQAARRAADGSASSIRLLRLAAGELRAVALALVGHFQAVDGEEASPGAHLAAKLTLMSETLLAQSEAPGAVRRLEEETVLLQPVLEFAVAQVAAGLGPSRRAWRIDSVPAGISLLADKRALNHILVNVLSGAAASTREGDGIGVSLLESEGALLLKIEDEGAGLPVAGSGGNGNRGMGYGLILARSLMEAHGGKLEVESLATIGTRISLLFPAERARRAA
jgi:signal transduction histidine kinase